MKLNPVIGSWRLETISQLILVYIIAVDNNSIKKIFKIKKLRAVWSFDVANFINLLQYAIIFHRLEHLRKNICNFVLLPSQQPLKSIYAVHNVVAAVNSILKKYIKNNCEIEEVIILDCKNCSITTIGIQLRHAKCHSFYSYAEYNFGQCRYA